VYGSDISDKMVEVSSSNLKNFKKSSNTDTVFQIEKLNSKFIEESGILRDEKIDSIVTE
jgi:tRNA G10  N-methylase Trm11